MSMEILVAHGVPQSIASAATSVGIAWTTLLGWIITYGPSALHVVDAVLKTAAPGTPVAVIVDAIDKALAGIASGKPPA